MKSNRITVISTILIPLTFIAFASVSCDKKEGVYKKDGDTTASATETSIKPYPIDTCLVSGEKLGSMGEPIIINHEGQEIKFCCDSCVPKFKKDPAKYLSKLDHAGHDH